MNVAVKQLFFRCLLYHLCRSTPSPFKHLLTEMLQCIAERTVVHEPNSLGDIVSNLVKNWEKELSYKVRPEDLRTMDPTVFRFSVNGGPKMNVEQLLELGSYNALIGDQSNYCASKSSAFLILSLFPSSPFPLVGLYDVTLFPLCVCVCVRACFEPGFGKVGSCICVCVWEGESIPVWVCIPAYPLLCVCIPACM